MPRYGLTPCGVMVPAFTASAGAFGATWTPTASWRAMPAASRSSCGADWLPPWVSRRYGERSGDRGDERVLVTHANPLTQLPCRESARRLTR